MIVPAVKREALMNQRQTSETIFIGINMAIAGGFMDAYSYLARGHVFANAQTGNMLLLGIGLFQGEYSAVVRYGSPILAFAIGIAIAEIIRFRKVHLLHWRQISVMIEMIVLATVAFLPEDMNLAANSLTSLACGIQVESFRSFHGSGAATTMCIGNLRSATENLVHWFQEKDHAYLRKSALYFCLIFCFVLGAVIGSAVIHMIGLYAILIDAMILIPAFIMMFTQKTAV